MQGPLSCDGGGMLGTWTPGDAIDGTLMESSPDATGRGPLETTAETDPPTR